MIQLFGIALLSFALSAAPQVRDAPAPAVTFRIKHLGIAVDGSFSDLQTSIRFDPARLAESSLEASVAVNTIQTGIALRDRHLQKKGYFDAEQYPRIRLVSKRIRPEGGHQYVGTFELTIRDVTREVTVPFTYAPKGSAGRFEGNFTINRRDFGVGGGSLVLADEVKVFIAVEASQQPF